MRLTKVGCANYHELRPLQKGIFLSPALLRIRKCSFTIEYAAFAAELKNKNLRFFARGLKLCKTLELYENNTYI